MSYKLKIVEEHKVIRTREFNIDTEELEKKFNDSVENFIVALQEEDHEKHELATEVFEDIEDISEEVSVEDHWVSMEEGGFDTNIYIRKKTSENWQELD